MTHAPTRTCVGCGRKAPQAELVRFCARDGALAFSPGGEGRSAYTCRRLACFERAVAKRAFDRVLRQRARPGPGLSALYTERQ